VTGGQKKMRYKKIKEKKWVSGGGGKRLNGAGECTKGRGVVRFTQSEECVGRQPAS